MPLTCTPAGFATAPSIVNLLPVTGVTSAREHQAYAKFVVKDGGSSVSLSLTVEDDTTDGGPNVPAVTARFNGCDLGTGMFVPGVGKSFESTNAATWQPIAGRFVTFEVVSPQGALLYRDVLQVPPVLPKILSVTAPAGPTAMVAWTPMPDAGITAASLFGWKRLGAGGLQSVGFVSISPSSGTVNLVLSQAAQLFQIEISSAVSPVARVRMSSDFDVP